MAADLELGLVWDRDQENFEVILRLTGPDGVDLRDHLRRGVTINLEALRRVRNDEPAYGALLSEMVFVDPKIQKFYEHAMILAGRDPVHFRLHLDGPAEFHQVRWESLRSPEEPHYRITTSSNVLFSRYLTSEDWRPIPLTDRPGRRALVVVAAPDLTEYPLAAVDLNAEINRARQALQGFQIDVLGGAGTASIGRITAALATFHYEVFYLVAHGRLVNNEPHLVLEDEHGRYERVDGVRLAEQLRGLDNRPTLAMLLSCQSADAGETTDDGLLAGLGPRLCGAGVPAVVAMQGNITMATAGAFASRFFGSFRQSPLVDHAMAQARLAVESRPDWWVPVLYSRLRSGSAYFRPVTEGWDDLALMARRKKITPILGPGLSDGILGSRSEIAQRWVRRWQMPIAFYGQSNLAQVAQYLNVSGAKARRTVLSYLEEYLMSDIYEHVEIAREGDPFFDLPKELLDAEEPLPIIHEVGRRMRADDPDDPYTVAAMLDAKVFFTTGWTGLLQDAMADQDKKPRTLCFPWAKDAKWVDIEGNDPVEWPPPSVTEPWVFQLFGRLDQIDSLVVTEDDYFAWLIAWVDKRPMMSSILSPFSEALTKQSLMFVGYQLRDWDFQVLFQSILSFPGSDQLRQSDHVGVQLRQNDDVIEPEAAQHYLETYLKTTNVKVFWQDTATFFKQLHEQIRRQR